jgi:hypothetical protein
VLNVRLEAGRHIYNPCLGAGLLRLGLMRSSKEARRVRPVKLKKGVECKPDAEGEAWPTARQQSQAMLFYGRAEPRIPGASNCGIISTVPPGFHSFVRGTDGSNPAFSSGESANFRFRSRFPGRTVRSSDQNAPVRYSSGSEPAWSGRSRSISGQEILIERDRTAIHKRSRCVPGMLNSSEVKVLYPTRWR